MHTLRNPEMDAFFAAILSLQTIEECYLFFEDACTIKEQQEICQRFQVAKLLESGKNYQEINSLTGASTATICRVNKCLNYGGGGYRTVIGRMKEGEMPDAE